MPCCQIVVKLTDGRHQSGRCFQMGLLGRCGDEADHVPGQWQEDPQDPAGGEGEQEIDSAPSTFMNKRQISC